MDTPASVFSRGSWKLAVSVPGQVGWSQRTAAWNVIVGMAHSSPGAGKDFRGRYRRFFSGDGDALLARLSELAGEALATLRAVRRPGAQPESGANQAQNQDSEAAPMKKPARIN
jgi:hypothetical protein